MTTSTDLDLVITRIFDAPRALVWQAWTDPKHAKAWGPKGFTTPVLEMDFTPGGAWRSVMVSPEGREYAQHGEVREVVPEEKLSFTSVWDDHPDEVTLVTITFTERGSRTEMHFRQSGFLDATSRDSHNGGWNEAFDALVEVVSRLT